MIKLKDILLSEKFASKAQQGYLFAKKPDVAKKLASKMSKQDYELLPDKVDEESLDEKGTRCWKGYKKKGMKTMFGKRVPNCVKNEAELPTDGFSTKKQMDVREEDVDENLKRWFDEKWTDQHGRPCGNKKTKGVKKCQLLN